MSTKIPYRPEIDGLRSIAILSVLFFHAGFVVDGCNPIPGGFLGVDVFFVISGYLIASLILKGLQEGSFSYRDFYERRARRILPILFTVMLVSLPFAWYLQLPSTMVDYCYSLLTSIFFTSNFWFWLDSSYWAADSNLKPFLHTWSLAVEEQFYFIMPLLLVLLYSRVKKAMFGVLLLLTAASLAFAHVASGSMQALAFFLLPARLWELLAGVLLATMEQERGRQPQGTLVKILPAAGVILIIISMFCFSENTRHPSLFTLAPVIGAMSILWFARADEIVTKILSSKIVVGIGLISYGLYIWHFPIFAFSRMIWDLSNFDKLLLCVASIVISSMTFFTIEKPARQRDFWSFKTLVRRLCLVMVALLLFAVPGISDGFDSRFPSILNTQTEPEKIKNHAWLMAQHPIGQRVILVGDSHMQALAPTLRDRFLEKGFDVAVSNFDDCPLLLGTNRVSKQGFNPGSCNASLQAERMAFISRAQPSFVILGGRLPLVIEEDRFNNQEGGDEGDVVDFLQNADNSLDTQDKRISFIKAAYKETVRQIIQAGHYVVLIYPIPEAGWHVPETLLRKMRADYFNAEKIAKEQAITTDYSVFKERVRRSYALLDDIASHHVIRIYPEKLFCNTEVPGRCMTHDRKHVYYRDSNHLSDYGAGLLMETIMQEVQMVYALTNKSAETME